MKRLMHPLQESARREREPMKEKDRIYAPELGESAELELDTMRLFEQDEDGHLVYASKLHRRWQKTYPPPGERRNARRVEWRHDVTCRILARQNLGAELEARTWNLSKGGVCLLLDERVEVGAYIDFGPWTEGTGVVLPLVQVLNVQLRGAVWVVSGRWRGGLDAATFRRLLGRRRTRATKQDRPPEKTGWLLNLWQKFQAAA
jgi:hypothetical protein